MIKKNIAITTITADIVNVDNGKTIITPADPVVTTKKVNDKNALKIYRAESGLSGNNIFITSVSTEVVKMCMNEETFMQYALKVE